MTSAYANSDNELQQDCPAPAHRPADAPAPATRAVIYMRVASPGRAEIDHSVTAQRAACLRTARELGFSLIDEYVDPDGGSRLWRRPKRQVFLRMLAWFRSR